MAKIIHISDIQELTSTREAFLEKNPILKKGQQAHEISLEGISTGRSKTGDGITAYDMLPYDQDPVAREKAEEAINKVSILDAKVATFRNDIDFTVIGNTLKATATIELAGDRRNGTYGGFSYIAADGSEKTISLTPSFNPTKEVTRFTYVKDFPLDSYSNTDALQFKAASFISKADIAEGDYFADETSSNVLSYKQEDHIVSIVTVNGETDLNPEVPSIVEFKIDGADLVTTMKNATKLFAYWMVEVDQNQKITNLRPVEYSSSTGLAVGSIHYISSFIAPKAYHICNYRNEAGVPVIGDTFDKRYSLQKYEPKPIIVNHEGPINWGTE